MKLKITILFLSFVTILINDAYGQTYTNSVKNTNIPQVSNFGNGQQPIQIDADNLEVRDKEKIAIFTGNVVAVQGTGILKANIMKVFYEDAPISVKSSEMGANTTPNTRNRKINRIEVTGKVRIEQAGQIGTGETGVYDMRNEQISLQGNVSLSQNGNVVQGDRLTINTKTQESTVSSGNGSGKRVRALIQNTEDKK